MTGILHPVAFPDFVDSAMNIIARFPVRTTKAICWDLLSRGTLHWHHSAGSCWASTPPYLAS